MKTRQFQLIEDLVKAMMEMQLPEIKEVDVGIGPYEYWGATGVDIQLDGEVEELEDVKLTLLVPKDYIYLTSANFSDFIAENVFEVDEAVFELEEMAKNKHKAIFNDEDFRGSKDYSEIIKLYYTVHSETQECSIEVAKLSFVFTWGDARMYREE